MTPLLLFAFNCIAAAYGGQAGNTTGGRSPLHFAAVFFPVAIVGDGGGAGFEGLGDEEAVEGVSVVSGELGDSPGVGVGHRQGEDAVPGELFVQRDWYLEGSSAGLAGRSHSIAARAYFADGACTVFDLIVI